MVRGVLPNLFGSPIPLDHQERIDRYTNELTDMLEQVALAALADRQPARMTWGIGAANFGGFVDECSVGDFNAWMQ